VTRIAIWPVVIYNSDVMYVNTAMNCTCACCGTPEGEPD